MQRGNGLKHEDNNMLNNKNVDLQPFVFALRQLYDATGKSDLSGEKLGKIVSSHLARLSQWVFESMTQLKPEGIEKESVLPAEFTDSMSATVSFVGVYSGSVSIHCPVGVAEVVAAHMTGFESAGERKDIPDAIGEMASVIAGEIKLSLSTGGLDIQLSTPEVISGSHYALYSADHRQVTINFTVEGQPVYVSMVVYRNRFLQVAATELRNKREWLALALEGGGLGLWKWNMVTGDMSYSDEWATMLGYAAEDLVPDIKTWEALIHPDDYLMVHSVLQDFISGRSSVCEVEHRLLCKSSEWRWVMSRGRIVEHHQDGSPKLIVGTNLDIDEQKLAALALRESERQLTLLNERLEERVVKEVRKGREKDSIMLHQDKLASIGKLAAGIAHEINNPMGFIMSNLRTLKNYARMEQQYLSALEDAVKVNCPEEQRTLLKALYERLDMFFLQQDVPILISESLDGAERVKQIVLDLKDFARIDESSLRETDLNHCIQSTANIVRNEIRYVAELDMQLGSIPQVICNPQQINQVIANLLVNAAHAMENFGAITVTTLHENDSVMMMVADTGCGISSEVVDKIFDPFFTTKEVGKGTGLGLSISYDIIKKHGGEIQVISELGVGTTFMVILPTNGPEAV